MKIKVSIPTEPVCTIKLEIEEARALLGFLTKRADIACMDMDKARTMSNSLIKELSKALNIDLEASLFDEKE